MTMRMNQITDVTPSTAVIRADHFWNDTGISLEAGGTYDMDAKGIWIDFFILSGPEGNPSPTWMQWLLASRLRVKGENYFTLIGTLDRDLSTAFCIGRRARVQAPRSGLLTCFANDVPGFYWNNRGTVQLTVTR